MGSKAELEQARVQLAGCGVAALGGITGKHLARQGDYGWSASYHDVLTLRKKYEAMLKRHPNEKLAQQYGTAEIVKEGGVPLLQIAKALVSLGLIVADHANQEHAVEHADEEQALERDLEAQRMAPTLEGLKAKQASAELAAIRSGRLMAKTAMGVPWATMGATAKGAMGALGNAAKAITPGWKTKALLGAGTLAAGAGAYKGMQAVRNELSTPVHETQRWGSNRPVMNNVSEFGYPTL